MNSRVHRQKSSTLPAAVQQKSFLAASLLQRTPEDLAQWLAVRRANGALDRETLSLARDLAVASPHAPHKRLIESELLRMNRRKERTAR